MLGLIVNAMPISEDAARRMIDADPAEAGWIVQDSGAANIHAGRGIALREFPLKQGHGFADDLLYVDGKAAGVIEAKKPGITLTGVETQSAKYSEGLPEALPAHRRPLPFLYQSTSAETRFTNRLDPDPRSRRVFNFQRPETLAAGIAEFPSGSCSSPGTPWRSTTGTSWRRSASAAGCSGSSSARPRTRSRTPPSSAA